MQIAINPDIYGPAQSYAEREGLNLTTIIEDFLVHFISSSKKHMETTKPNEIEITPGAAWCRRGNPWKASDEEVDNMIREYILEKYK